MIHTLPLSLSFIVYISSPLSYPLSFFFPVTSLTSILLSPSETQQQADDIALAVEVTYESQGKPLLTISDAIEAGSYFENPGADVLRVGDAKGRTH